MFARNGKHKHWTWESGDPPPEHLSAQELANYLRADLSYVHHLCGEQSAIPHIRLSRKRLLFMRSEIDDWMSARRVRVFFFQL